MMALSAGVVIWIFTFLFLIPVSAATFVSVGSEPATSDQSQEFELDVGLNCTSCTGDSYLRGVFYTGGTSYFGFTQVSGGGWVNASGGSCTQYFKVATSDLVEGSWSGKLKVRPDAESSLYSGPGEYLFKVGRYTGSCGSPTWSDEMTIAITGPTSTPTPHPTNTPTPTPIHTPTPTPTKAPTTTKSPTPTPTPEPPSDDITASDESISASPIVLGAVQAGASVSAVHQESADRQLMLSLALIGSGLAILSFAFVLKVRRKHRSVGDV